MLNDFLGIAKWKKIGKIIFSETFEWNYSSEHRNYLSF